MDVSHYSFAPPPGASSFRIAVWLLDRGFWPVPVLLERADFPPTAGESPLAGWGGRRPSVDQLRAVYRWHPAAGVGVAFGPRERLVDLEFDDSVFAGEALARIFPGGTPETLGWRSARGEHRLFLWDARLATLAAPAVLTLAQGALELRIGSTERRVASVCPPTATSCGTTREWNGVWRVARLPDTLVAEVGAELEVRARARADGRSVPLLLPLRADRCAIAALASEVELVRTASGDQRARVLGLAAFKLAHLIGAGLIRRGDVEVALAGAAASAGLAAAEVEIALRTGLESALGRAVRTRKNRRG